MQMKGLVLANLHLFKKADSLTVWRLQNEPVQEQQKSLQNGRRADRNSTAMSEVHAGTPLQLAGV